MTKSSEPEEYNRRSFATEGILRGQDPAHLDFQPALHVGMAAPDFAVRDLTGNPVRLSDFRGKQHVLFEFGCITAPAFINDIASLNRLHRQFHEQDVQVLVIYAREAHPGERYRAHTSFEQKSEYARELRELEGIEFPVLVDSLAGDAHRTYGLRPSPVYGVNKDGRIIYKASWLIPEEAEFMLGRLLQWEGWEAKGLRPMRYTYSEMWTALGINPAVHERVFARTGGDAREEVRRAFGYDVVDSAR
jgi:hypothetical protein